jgi:hypothetical protein
MEIAGLILIVWNAWKWTNPATFVPAVEVARKSASDGASIPQLMSGLK